MNVRAINCQCEKFFKLGQSVLFGCVSQRIDPLIFKNFIYNNYEKPWWFQRRTFCIKTIVTVCNNFSPIRIIKDQKMTAEYWSHFFNVNWIKYIWDRYSNEVVYNIMCTFFSLNIRQKGNIVFFYQLISYLNEAVFKKNDKKPLNLINIKKKLV